MIDANAATTKLIDGATAIKKGEAVQEDTSSPRSFQLTVVGTGAVTAAATIYASDDGVGWGPLGTISASGTNVGSDVFGNLVPYQYYYADLTAITGTNATATVTMKV